MLNWRLSGWLCAITLGGCTAGEPRVSDRHVELASQCRAIEVPYGNGAGQVGFDPAGDEHLARGPQAAAVTPGGDVLLLDAVHRRVVALDVAGPRTVVHGLARDVEALAAGDDGAFAVFGPLQSKAWVFEPDGTPAGDVTIDRAHRHIAGISIGPSRTILVRSAYQETHTAGSPAAPVALASQLHGKREGAFVLPDGRGVVVRKNAAGLELAVVTNTGRRSQVSAVHSIGSDLDAASLFGVAGQLACLRTERVQQIDDRLVVSRRARCMDVVTGQLAVDLALPAVGPYLPAHELAIGGTPVRLVALEPASDYLTVRVCEVAR